ncbi:Gfo/Idh/MocA family oxidoreductase [Alkalihalobacillus sp. LMS39]|uniref:Gfo/Idh/MocA family protein n=1 Tax=Alkalihalobacillus sp. LMS39 TaxID=2924032 RepID=UPI00326038D7
MIKWGVLGNAGIAKKEILPAILRAENAEITAIASRGDQVKETAEKFSIPKVYRTYDDLLQDEEIQVVYIPLPNALHKEWVIKAAEHKKHVLCEKPAAITVEDVEAMIQACNDNGVLFMEAFMYQFHPQHERVKEIIASGEIGTVQRLTSTFSFTMDLSQDNIRLNPELGGGSLFDVGCYCIHTFRNLLDEEPIDVYCDGVFSEQKVDLSAHGIIRFPNNVMATFDSSFQQYPINDYAVVGSNGTIHVTDAFRPDKNDHIGKIIVSTNDTSRTEEVAGDQYKLQIEHFSQSVINNEQPVYSSEKIVKNMIALTKCQQSLMERTIVTF